MMGNVKRWSGRIVPDTVELYGETFLREEIIDAHFVELEGALKGLISVIEAAGLNNLSNGVQLGPTVWYVKASDALRAAKQVIAPPSPKCTVTTEQWQDLAARLGLVEGQDGAWRSEP